MSPHHTVRTSVVVAFISAGKTADFGQTPIMVHDARKFGGDKTHFIEYKDKLGGSLFFPQQFTLELTAGVSGN